jgi:hypothetical protein
MGQDIKYIITTEPITVPINIVHFTEKNATIFPLLLDDGDYEDISDDAKEFQGNIQSFFNIILSSTYDIVYPTERLFLFMQQSGLTSLGWIGHREICDLPHDIGMPILFLDNEIVTVTNKESPEDEVHQKLGAEILFREIIGHENRYWSYEDAEVAYLENLKKGSLS